MREARRRRIRIRIRTEEAVCCQFSGRHTDVMSGVKVDEEEKRNGEAFRPRIC